MGWRTRAQAGTGWFGVGIGELGWPHDKNLWLSPPQAPRFESPQWRIVRWPKGGPPLIRASRPGEVGEKRTPGIKATPQQKAWRRVGRLVAERMRQHEDPTAGK